MPVKITEDDYQKAKTTSPNFRTYIWNESQYHCRHCGTKPLLVEVGEGDYYVGPSYWCRACGEIYTMG